MSKAQAFALTQMLQLLMTGVVAVTLGFLLVGEYTQVEKFAIESEVDRHAIALANLLASNPSLIYFDGSQFHRGVFDQPKLNSLMVTKSKFISEWKNYINPNQELSEELAYPNSYSLIIVSSEKDSWAVALAEAKAEDKFNLQEFLECLKTHVRDSDIPKLFEQNSAFPQNLKLPKCASSYSKILNYGFPVAVRYNDESVFPALLKVLVVENE